MPLSKPAPGTFGARIRWARSRRAMSQQDIADGVGVSQPTVANWENDVNQPRPNAMKRLVDLLDIAPRWLMYGEGPPNASGVSFDIAPWGYLARSLHHVPVFSPPIGDAVFDPMCETPVDYVACCADCLRPFGLRIDAERSSPIAPEGAVMVFDAAVTEPEDAAIHLVEIDGRPVLRRWRTGSARWEPLVVGDAPNRPESARSLGEAVIAITPLGPRRAA